MTTIDKICTGIAIRRRKKREKARSFREAGPRRQVGREQLLERLRLLRPALADKGHIVGLKHLWFDGVTARACNNIIGVVAPWQSVFTGGVMGKSVVGILEKSRAKDAIIEVGSAGELVLRIGGAKARLPLLPLECMRWEFPDDPGGGVPITPAMYSALKHVMISVPSGPDSSGVTVVSEGNVLAFYASDGKTIAWARVPLPKGYDASRLVLSPLFCRQVVRWCEGGSLAFMDECVLARSANGAVVFGKLVELERDLDFAKALKDNLPDSEPVGLPSILSTCLDRVSVMTGGAAGASVQISVNDTFMKLYACTDLGDLNDAVKLRAKHKKCSARFDVDMLRRGLDLGKTFIVTERAFAVFGEGDSGYAVAATVKEG